MDDILMRRRDGGADASAVKTLTSARLRSPHAVRSIPNETPVARTGRRRVMMPPAEVGGFLLAVIAGVVVVGLPGLALCRVFQWPGARDRLGFGDRFGFGDGFLLGFATLPVIDALAARLVSLDVALGLNLSLAGIALAVWLRWGRPVPRPDLIVCALLIAWMGLVVFDSLDLILDNGLYPPLTTFDMIKHAAVTQAIVDKGAPPPDPFFLRPERASYYYFFYVLSALVERLGGGLIDARAAVCGLIFWVGVALYKLFRFVVRRAGGVDAPRWLILLVLATGGLDIVMVLRIALALGRWLPQPDDWNEQITGWYQSVLWVPHHLCGLMAAMIGMAVVTAPAGSARWRRIGLCALCFAATFGLSVWVFLGLAVTLAIWLVAEVVRRRWQPALDLVAAGLVAAALVLPQLLDLLHGRALGGSTPVIFSVRLFGLVEGLVPDGVWLQTLRAVLLPTNYLAVFGAIMFGSILYWRQRSSARWFDTEFDRILALSGLVGLLIGSFVKSTMINNDLGWRIMLFPLLAGSVWTFRVLADLTKTAPTTRGARTPFANWPPLIVGLVVIGVLTNVYAVFSLRLAPWLMVAPGEVPAAAGARVENDLRTAYLWADRNMKDAVLQQNPLHHGHSALYGPYRVSVEDLYASIFGADAKAVTARILTLAKVFCEALPDAQVGALARQNGVEAYVVTARDPVWARPESFVWREAPLFATPTVRIMPSAPASKPMDVVHGTAAATEPSAAYPYPPDVCGPPKT